jgi:LysM repeat protein
MPSGTLKRLNPALVRGATPPSGDYPIVVPADTGEKFSVALASLVKEPKRGVASLEGRTFHVVKKGETLASIAAKYDVDQRDIVSANKIRLANRLPVGKKLLIPSGATSTDDAGPQSTPPAPDATTAPVETKEPAPKPAAPRKYRVQKGDTLYKIALDNNVGLEALQLENKLDKHARIHVNQELIIPGSASEELAAVPAPAATHIVGKGETLAVIAQKYDVKVDDIVANNNLTSTTIHVGDKLIVARATEKRGAIQAKSAPGAGPSKTPKEKTPDESYGTYTVAAGDTLSAIAARHGMKLKEIQDANGLADNATIKIGQKLKVKGGEAAPQPEKTMDVAISKPTVEKAASPPGEKAAGVRMHTVEKGQTLSEIAGTYNVKVSELVAWNNLGDRALIHVGQKLIVATPKVTAATASSDAKTDGTRTVHKVTEGQSPASIAKRYGVKVGDLFAWNSWKKDHILHIGDDVIVFTK